MGRKKKLTTHEATGDKKPIQSIYQLIGMNDYPYKTLDEDVYSEHLQAMDIVELQDHAIDVGITPTDDRERLTDRLVKKFLIEAGSQKAAAVGVSDNTLSENKSSAALKKILNHGR